MKAKVFLGIIVLFAILQLLPRDKAVNAEVTGNDLLKIENPSPEIAQTIKKACYDCHSNQSEFPWYSELAPLSWWIDDHIEEGRSHLNFSEWGTYKKDKKAHKAEEAHEEIEEDEMPLWSYQLAHSAARLNQKEKEILINWFKELEEKY